MLTADADMCTRPCIHAWKFGRLLNPPVFGYSCVPFFFFLTDAAFSRCTAEVWGAPERASVTGKIVMREQVVVKCVCQTSSFWNFDERVYIYL